MELCCLGVSHKTAPLSVRERLAFSELLQLELLSELGADGLGVVLVSTCNRVELYLSAPSLEEAKAKALGALAQRAGEELREHLYLHEGEAALTHLFRVASSLDSMVVGEPQILGQVKDAVELARKAQTVAGELGRACQAAFACAKRVRSETGVGRAATSMASAAVELASKIFGGLSGRKVLVVGAGEMAELAARHLKSAGASSLVVVNRTLSRAQALAATVQAEAAPFEELGARLIQADVVVCSTAAPRPILDLSVLSPVVKARKHRPLFLVDLAVPRDVAPEVNSLEGVYAYDVDDIQAVVAENAAARAAEAAKAEGLVQQEVAKFLQLRAVRQQVPILGQLRARAEQIARGEAERTLSRLGPLEEKHRKSIEAMAQAIVNKILHQPTVKLRETGANGDAERLADAAAELFGLAEDEARNPNEPEPANEPELEPGSAEKAS